VVALSARQLCLGKVGSPLNFRADACCHGNEIWPRPGELDAYRLVRIIFTTCACKYCTCSLQANGSPPCLSYHSCTLYGHEMWVFGGVYPCPDPLPDDCSNELYVFNLFEENWYKPLVMGNKPSPRSGQVFHNHTSSVWILNCQIVNVVHCGPLRSGTCWWAS